VGERNSTEHGQSSVFQVSTNVPGFQGQLMSQLQPRPLAAKLGCRGRRPADTHSYRGSAPSDSRHWSPCRQRSAHKKSCRAQAGSEGAEAGPCPLQTCAHWRPGSLNASAQSDKQHLSPSVTEARNPQDNARGTGSRHARGASSWPQCALPLDPRHLRTLF